VWVILYGEDGADTGRLKLNKAGNNFEKGKTDVFDVSACCKRLLIQHGRG
jgi:hypothetical protein